MKNKWLGLVMVFGLILCCPALSFAKDYNVKVKKLESDLYSIVGTSYVVRTSMCYAKAKKGESKEMPAKLTISALGNRLNFEGKKSVCSVVKVYKEHKGALEGV